MMEVVEAQAVHCRPIALNMRQADRDEIKKFARNTSPIRGINASLRHSLIAWTVLKDGEPIAMFGACELSCISREGVVWFLGTEETRKHARQYLTRASFYVREMLKEFEHLHNKIDYDNRLAIRFAQKLMALMPSNIRLSKEPDGLKIEVYRDV